jgi:glycosyltransferase involved in cell wall biosynthesis
MRILLVTPFFPPQNSAASTRTYGFARSWSKAGHEVTVLTTEKRRDQRGFEVPFGGFQVIAIPILLPRFLESLRASHMAVNESSSYGAGSSSWFTLLQQLRDRTGIFCSVRMPDLTDFWIKPALTWARSQNQRWDWVVSSSGPYTAHLVARKVKKERRSSFWAADFQDLWTDHHARSGLFPFTTAERVLERSCLKQASLITTVSEEWAERFRTKTKAPVAVVYNGYDGVGWSQVPPRRIFPDDGRVRLVYTGTLYPQGQDPTPFLQALSRLAAADANYPYRLEVVVASLYEKHWLAMARQAGVGEFVKHVGALSRQDILTMQHDAEALLLVDSNGPSAGVIPSKVFEYLRADSPILAVGGSAMSALGRLLSRTGRGVHLSGNVEEIMNFLRRLADRTLDLRLIRNEQEICRFSTEHQAIRYLQLLEHRVCPVGLDSEVDQRFA